MAEPGRRAGERASASTGQPSVSASRCTAAGSPLSAPDTITPDRPDSRSANSSTSDGAIRGAAVTRCHGAPWWRPGGSGPGWPTNGSRKARFRWTGPGRPPAPAASATARDARDRQLDEVASSGTPGSARQRSGPPVEVGLIDGLGGADAMGFRWPVGGDGQEGDAGVMGFDDGRMQLHRRRPAGGEDEGRPAGAQSDAQGEEGRPTVRRERRGDGGGDRRPGPGPWASTGNRDRARRRSVRPGPTRRPGWRRRWRPHRPGCPRSYSEPRIGGPPSYPGPRAAVPG